MNESMKVKADFSGGLDLVFDNKSQIILDLEYKATVAHAIKKLADSYANSKK